MRLENKVTIITGGANACLFLASDEAKYVHGHVLQVDGGIIM